MLGRALREAGEASLGLRLGWKLLEGSLTAVFTPSSAEPVLPGPPIAPYSLPKEDIKWPPTLQPPVGLGPPAPDPNLLAPPSGNPAGFRQLLPEVLETGSLAPNQPPTEQLLPDLLISPHMLPCKDLGGPGGLAGQSSSGAGAGLKVEGGGQRK